MKPTRRLFLNLALAAMPATVLAAGTDTNAPPSGDLLLLDEMGRVVAVPTNEVPSGFQPPAGIGVKRQIPTPVTGASLPMEILRRLRASTNGFQFFPATPPVLMPYLGSVDEYGNTAIRPGALLNLVPLEGPVQNGKYWLSEFGFRDSLQQTINGTTMTGVKKGDNDLG